MICLVIYYAVFPRVLEGFDTLGSLLVDLQHLIGALNCRDVTLIDIWNRGHNSRALLRHRKRMTTYIRIRCYHVRLRAKGHNV